MRRFFLLLPLLAARLVAAAPAVVNDDGAYCAGWNSRGESIVLAGRIVVTQPLFPNAPVGTGPTIVHCEGNQGFRAGRLMRFEDVCTFAVPGGALPGRATELITPAGGVVFDCLIQP